MEVEAAWLHHRFSQIHPFADGNGRVARVIASLLFIKAGWFPLIVRRDEKARYIESLELADAGDLRPLVALVGESQRTSLLLADEALDRPVASTSEAIAAVRERLLRRGRSAVDQWNLSKQTAGKLQDFAKRRFDQVAEELERKLPASGPGTWHLRRVTAQRVSIASFSPRPCRAPGIPRISILTMRLFI